MGLTSEERLAYKVLHEELNAEVDFEEEQNNNAKDNMRQEEEEDNISLNDDNIEEILDDIPVVPLELLDEAELKLQASMQNEEQLRNETNKLLHEKEANDLQYKQKISSLEKALKNKTDLLIAALKDKGEIHKRR